MKRMILLIYRDLSVPLPPIPGTALRGFWSRRLFEYTDIIVKREEALERALNSISSQWNSLKKKGKWKSGYGHWKVCQEMLFNTWDKISLILILLIVTIVLCVRKKVVYKPKR